MRHIKGQSLFEVVVAVSVITLIIVAVVILTTTSIRNNSFSRNKTIASRYGQEAVEWLRGQRDADWTIFRNRADTSLVYCLKTLSWSLAGPCASSGSEIDGTIFKRQVTFEVISEDGNEYLRADIAIFWLDGQGEHVSESITYFSDWNK